MDERQQPLAGSDEKGAFGRVPGRGVGVVGASGSCG